MSTTLNPKFQYMERKSKFYEIETEQWLNDHKAAQRCLEFEERIRDLNRHVSDIFELDCACQKELLENGSIVNELDTILTGFFSRWLEMASALQGFEGRHGLVQEYEVDGLVLLNNNISEVEALLNPSYELNEGMAQLRDQAIEEHRQNNTIEGLVD